MLLKGENRISHMFSKLGEVYIKRSKISSLKGAMSFKSADYSVEGSKNVLFCLFFSK